MNLTSRRLRPVCRLFIGLFLAALPLPMRGGDQPNPQFPGLEWRLIGPFRAGRVTAVAGVPGDPSTFYFGTPGGGVWKTSDGGQVWHPIFDKERVASIGALAVAPSDSRVVYVGTGEQTRGHGLYRSSDSGVTWQSAGLGRRVVYSGDHRRSAQSDVVVVAGNSVGMGLLWQPLPRWARTANRGIFKTTDGGKSWKKVFSDDDYARALSTCAPTRAIRARFMRSSFGPLQAKANPK